jgi:predicted DsbA family dithiol-disulfide isomerase
MFSTELSRRSFTYFDVKKFAKLGVMMTPAVIVDGKIVVSGKAPTVEELKKILSEIK